MRIPARFGRLSLTRQVALLSLVPMVVLGFVLARVLQAQIVSRTLADSTESARIIAHLAIEPHLNRHDLQAGLSPAGIRALDQQLSARSVTADLARIKVWNSRYKVIYSDDHSLIGRTLKPSDDLLDALAGRPDDADVVTPEPGTETASEVGLGRLVEVYVPLRFAASGPPEGAFEIYLSYRPIAAALSHDKRTIALIVAIGLALLWAMLYPIVIGASRRLRRSSRENYRLARYDQLTGLPNRTRFIETMSKMLSRGGASDCLAVLMIDIDRFTELNNTLGQDGGDRVLGEVAERLRAAFAPHARLARLGADEFALLCPHADGEPGALRAAELVQSCLEPAVAIDGVTLNVEASIGVALSDPELTDANVLLQRADTALARARSRSTRVHVHSPRCDYFNADGLLLLGQVRQALEQDEFVLYYQPKVDLQAEGRVTGVEALVRWQHPERGLLAPGQFIPLIEPTALVGPFTEHVIEQALAQMVAWRRRGIDLEMSVNLSARNLLDADIADRVAALLAQHGIPPERLTLEVTESAALVDPERAIAALEALRANGAGVSVDDFGTGNASIEYLTNLPASELKIDRSFITDMLEDKRAQAIVRSTVDLARNLGLTLVAEGIETQDVMDHLAALGCQTGQGYFFSRPLPAGELTERLAAQFGIATTAEPPVAAPVVAAPVA